MNPYTEYVLDILYMTSEKEFIVVYAGLMMSAEGLIARPRIHARMMTGTMKRVAVASDQSALIGYIEELDVPMRYATWDVKVPGALPALLVTGKPSGMAMKTIAAAAESTAVEAMAQSSDIPNTFLPLPSLPSEATEDASVMNATGTAMRMPNPMKYSETAESIPSVCGNDPKSMAVASPMRSAAR